MKRLVLVFLGLVIACGKRGDPHPPIPAIPKATSDLVVTQRGVKLLLSWSYPALTTAGKTLGSIKRVSVYRYVAEVPPTPPALPAAPPATTTAPAAAAPASAATVPAAKPPAVPAPASQPAPPPSPAGKAATPPSASGAPAASPVVQPATAPPVMPPAQFAKLGQKIDSIESASLAGASVGAKLVYEDTPPALHSASGRPLRIIYAVVTEGLAARSDFSNLVSITPLDVAAAPETLVATAKAEGVALTWAAPARAASDPKAKPAIAGYNIYRVSKGESLGQFPVPVNAALVKKTESVDVPSYGTFDYYVTAVAAEGAPRIESDPSAPATATFKDLVAPPPPATLTALVETKVVRLVWDPVDVPDLAGYKVYRTEAAGRVNFTPGLPIKQTHFGDESLLPGIEYYYSVTAVDKSGNESAETKSQKVMVPKTP